MIKKTFILVFILLCISSLIAQSNSVIDNLKDKIKVSLNKDSTVFYYNELSNQYYNNNYFDSSIKYSNLGNKFGLDNNIEKYISNNLFLIGSSYYNIGEYSQSVNSLNKSISSSKSNSQKIQALCMISLVHFGLKDTVLAKKKINEANQFLTDTSYEDINWVLTVSAQITSSKSKKIELYERTIKNILKFNKNNYYDLSATYYSMGILYSDYNEINKAEKSYQKALYYANKTDLQSLTMNVNYGLGGIYIKQKKYKLALKYFNLVKSFSEETNNKYFMYSSYFYTTLCYASEELRNYDSLNYYLIKYDETRAELFNEEKHKQIAELETKYQTEKKEKENQELAYQNQLIEKENQYEKRKGFIFIWGGIFLLALIVLAGILFYKQRKTKFENDQYKLEQKLLRSQMNPHFMSNFLMAIKTAIQKENKEKSIEYLDQFGVLSRQVLEASVNDFVLLENEISFLNNYLSLQQLVSHNKFSYEIILKDDIDETEIMIPPMLIQPFIENAIEHGFRGLENKGEIKIEFSLKDNQIIAEVIDNGIGRNNKGEVVEKKHQSRSTQIINDRITLFKRKWNKDIIFNIMDMNIGTKVVFKLPIKDVVFS